VSFRSRFAMKIFKSVAKFIIARATPHIPWARFPLGSREFIFEQLYRRRGPWLTLSELARECGVSGFSIRGDYGFILGSSADRGIVQIYAESGQWAERANRTFVDFFAGRAGTYVDVGANIGLTTIPVAQNPKVRCIALEPEPSNYEFLVANVARNCTHGNVSTRQVAAFSRRGSLDLELAPENLGDHRIRLGRGANRMGEDQRPTVKIDALPLDEIVGPVEGPLAVKIDTQGAEPFVIQGGQATLKQAELIVMEFCPYMIGRMGGDPETIAAFIERNFGSATLAFREAGELESFRQAREVANDLRELATSKRDTLGYYFDVILKK
jgi:FkbM family methyltransferase